MVQIGFKCVQMDYPNFIFYFLKEYTHKYENGDLS